MLSIIFLVSHELEAQLQSVDLIADITDVVGTEVNNVINISVQTE